jgi:hypothetical protein
MPTFEEDVEALLLALRTVDLPCGMQQRVLDACASRAHVQTKSSWHRMQPTWLRKLTDPNRKNFK